MYSALGKEGRRFVDGSFVKRRREMAKLIFGQKAEAILNSFLTLVG